MSNSEWIAETRRLYESFNGQIMELNAISQQRVKTLKDLEQRKFTQVLLERQFWLAMEEQGLLAGSNDAARKMARERAYAEHGNGTAYLLETRAKEIAELENVARVLEIQSSTARERLDAFQSQEQLLSLLLMYDQQLESHAEDSHAAMD